MNKPSKCKNCQWYGKPYWSIINPCDNCLIEKDYKTIIQIDGEPVFKETLTEEEIKKAMTDKSIFELTIEEKDKEIERLNNIISIKTTYIEDLLKSIFKSTDIKIQKEVYERGIEYDKKLKELKEKSD